MLKNTRTYPFTYPIINSWVHIVKCRMWTIHSNPCFDCSQHHTLLYATPRSDPLNCGKQNRMVRNHYLRFFVHSFFYYLTQCKSILLNEYMWQTSSVRSMHSITVVTVVVLLLKGSTIIPTLSQDSARTKGAYSPRILTNASKSILFYVQLSNSEIGSK